MKFPDEMNDDELNVAASQAFWNDGIIRQFATDGNAMLALMEKIDTEIISDVYGQKTVRVRIVNCYGTFTGKVALPRAVAIAALKAKAAKEGK